MPFAGFEVNAEASDPLTMAIGKLMVNFGSIELLTYLWIDALTSDDVLKDLALDMLFARRTEVICKLLERAEMPNKLRNDARTAWKQAVELAKLRNDVAHSPIVFGWHGDEGNRPHDYIASYPFKKLKGQKQRRVPLVEMKVVTKGVDTAARIAQNLYQLLETVKSEGGGGRPAPARHPQHRR